MSDAPPFKPEDYRAMLYPELEQCAQSTCCCCNMPFTRDNPVKFASKCCGTEATIVEYWEGWLYFSCADCDRPIVKVPVDRHPPLQSQQQKTQTNR